VNQSLLVNACFHAGQCVFDNADKGLNQEPFVRSTRIERRVKCYYDSNPITQHRGYVEIMQKRSATHRARHDAERSPRKTIARLSLQPASRMMRIVKFFKQRSQP
jgi:hypothetical protein